MTDSVDNVAKMPQRVPVSAGAFPKAIVPADMDEAWRVAKLVVASGLAPRDVQTPERAMVAIMTGLELGLPPMTAIQRIAVINGRPCIWGDAVPALAQRTGMLEKWDEGITGEGDNMVAHCTVTRRINAETTITKTATFSVADAKKAGLWTIEAKVERKTRDGSKYVKDNDSPWYRFPKRMLQMRARVAFRDLFADAMCGLYIAEEMVSGNSDAEMRDVTPQHETIHNPLQDDAEASIADAGVGDTIRSFVDNVLQQKISNEMEVMPPSGQSNKVVPHETKLRKEVMPIDIQQPPDTSPPGATGGEERVKAAEYFDAVSHVAVAVKIAPLPDHDPETGEVFDSPADKPPRQAREKPASELRPEEAPKQPKPEKASPAPNPALGVALEQPWIKKTPADYIAYLWKWTEAWAKWGQDPIGLRDRFSAERTIRNGLGVKMDDKQLAECKAIAAGAFSKLGGQLK